MPPPRPLPLSLNSAPIFSTAPLLSRPRRHCSCNPRSTQSGPRWVWGAPQLSPELPQWPPGPPQWPTSPHCLCPLCRQDLQYLLQPSSLWVCHGYGSGDIGVLFLKFGFQLWWWGTSEQWGKTTALWTCKHACKRNGETSFENSTPSEFYKKVHFLCIKVFQEFCLRNVIPKRRASVASLWSFLRQTFFSKQCSLHFSFLLILGRICDKDFSQYAMQPRKLERLQDWILQHSKSGWTGANLRQLSPNLPCFLSVKSQATTWLEVYHLPQYGWGNS